MYYNKQIIINKLLLPEDILENIKSYCFYDMKTAIIRIFITNKRKEISKILNSNNCFSRRNPKQYFHYSNYYDNWYIYIPSEYIISRNNRKLPLLLQGENCYNCGGFSYYSRGATRSTICNCPIISD